MRLASTTAARDERLPSVAVNADYGDIGTSPAQSHGTYTAMATLRVPIWEGGRIVATSSKRTRPPTSAARGTR